VIFSGVWPWDILVQNSIFSGSWPWESGTSFEAWLYQERWLVDGDGRADLQHVALVDPHRKFTTVRSFSHYSFPISMVNWWHWFVKINDRWDYVEVDNRLLKDMNRFVAYYKGLTTWAKWIERNINPSQTKVFFLGISPVHYV